MNINFGLHSQTQGRLQVHALSASYCPSSYPTFSESRAGQSRSLEDCGSILLAVGRLDYIVITSYVSQLVNHLRTRTPMGGLVEQSRLALDL